MDRGLRQLLDQYLSSIEYQMDGLLSGQSSIDDWQIGMAQDAIVYQTAAYMSGLDSDHLTAAQRQTLTAAIQEQVDYLNQFAADLDAEADVTDRAAWWRARATLYAGAVKEVWWRGATDDYVLPGYPGDGGTACGGRCGCQWDIRADGAYWVRGKSDSCAECVQREEEWSPWPIPHAWGDDDEPA